MYDKMLLTLYIGLAFVIGVLAFMNLDLQEKNKELEEKLSETERIKKLAMNKRTILSAKKDFENDGYEWKFENGSTIQTIASSDANRGDRANTSKEKEIRLKGEPN